MDVQKNIRVQLAFRKKQDEKSYLLPVIVATLFASLALMVIAQVISSGGFPFQIRFLSTHLNDILFSGAPPVFSDISLLNDFIIAFMRASALGAVSGLYVLSVLVWTRARDLAAANLYVAAAGMTVGIPFTCVFFTKVFLPIILEAFGV